MPGDVKPLGIVPRETQRQTDIVEILERYLENARKGEFEHVVIIAELTTGSSDPIRFCSSGAPDILRLIGKLEMVKADLLMRMAGDDE